MALPRGICKEESMQAIGSADDSQASHAGVHKGSAASAALSHAKGWRATALMVAAGAVFGGYLGGVSVLYAWACARPTVLNSTVSARRRLGTGLLAVASAIVLYSTGLSIYQSTLAF
jgi:hypothetical protein